MMLMLGEAFESTLTETRITIYYQALLDLPEQDVLQAMSECIKTCKFFPRVAEIREIVGDQREARRDRERAERIDAENERRRLEVEQWRKDRAERRGIEGPAPIKMFVKPVLKELTAEQIEARKGELRDQAKGDRDRKVLTGA